MPDTFASMLMVVSLSLVATGLLLATAYSLYRAYAYSLNEFLACCFAAFFGVASYVVAKRMGFGMQITSRWENLASVFREPPFWWVLALGLFCGYFYARQLRLFSLWSFRWALIVLCWSHAVTLELLASILKDSSASSGADILGAVFVMALSLVSVFQIPGRRRRAGADRAEDEDSPPEDPPSRPEAAKKDVSMVDPF